MVRIRVRVRVRVRVRIRVRVRVRVRALLRLAGGGCGRRAELLLPTRLHLVGDMGEICGRCGEDTLLLPTGTG